MLPQQYKLAEPNGAKMFERDKNGLNSALVSDLTGNNTTHWIGLTEARCSKGWEWSQFSSLVQILPLTLQLMLLTILRWYVGRPGCFDSRRIT